MNKLFLIVSFLLLTQFGRSQMVDIVKDCDGVYLKSTETFDQIISSLVFVISWPIESTLQMEVNPSFRSILKSGPEFVKVNRRYQTFSWIGYSHLNVNNEKIDQVGLKIMNVFNSDFRIEAGESQLNSEFYVALNGYPSTGKISSNECQTNSSIFVFPNPTRNEITIQILRGKYNKLNLFSSRGSLVYSTRIQSETTKIDVRHLAPGQYTLVLEGKLRYSTKIIIEK